MCHYHWFCLCLKPWYFVHNKFLYIALFFKCCLRILLYWLLSFFVPSQILQKKSKCLFHLICLTLVPVPMASHSSTLAGKSHERRSLVGCSPWGHKELDTTEWLDFHFHLHLLVSSIQCILDESLVLEKIKLPSIKYLAHTSALLNKAHTLYHFTILGEKNYYYCFNFID